MNKTELRIHIKFYYKIHVGKLYFNDKVYKNKNKQIKMDKSNGLLLMHQVKNINKHWDIIIASKNDFKNKDNIIKHVENTTENFITQFVNLKICMTN